MLKPATRYGLMALWIAISGPAFAASARVDGNYAAIDEPGLTLELKESPQGAITGAMSQSGIHQPLRGNRSGTTMTGTVGSGGESIPFTAKVSSDQIALNLGSADAGAQQVRFRRASGAAAGATAGAAVGRNVIINGRQLSANELARIEAAYRIRINDADYWYDPILGAWGVRGSPTLGFISAGLNLGGALHANASAGTTGVFVNGRQLPAADLLALQRLTGPILPGRYFITAQGLAGYEGGMPQWNLAAMASQGAGGGGSNTWQGRITGSSGFSDGTTGAVFLPNGGIVSTGN